MSESALSEITHCGSTGNTLSTHLIISQPDSVFWHSRGGNGDGEPRCYFSVSGECAGEQTWHDLAAARSSKIQQLVEWEWRELEKTCRSKIRIESGKAESKV